METNKTKNTDLFLIDPRNIVVVDGFNVRRDFDLDELKEQIKAKGVLNPLTVIAFKDDEGNEKYKLVDGERRYRATMLAISEGADIPYVRAMKARKDASTEELYIQQMMRNEGKKFTEYECAIMFRRFKEELQAKLAKANAENKGMVVYPEYFKKKKKRMRPDFIKKLEETAKADFTDVDDYGVYKVGSFLYRNAFVTISKEDGLWTLHVISEAPIGLPLIKEVRYKYLPNNLMMAQIFGDRAEANEIKGVILYQIPNGEMEAE